MPPFEPFRGLRYDLERSSLAEVTAPPYDVIDGPLRARLTARSPHNAVWVDLLDEAEGPDRYSAAAERLDRWLDEGVLVPDDRPALTVYRMGYVNELGEPAHTLGVIGALGLSAPGEGAILPHEHTTPKAKTDRLDLLRATRTNLSALWGLSLTKGLTALLEVPDPPLAAWTGDGGVDHAVWRIDDPARVAAISEAVGASPVVIADGHHRYETSLTYRAESGAEGSTGGAGAAMALVVELTEDQLTVGPIHRLLAGLPADLDLVETLGPWFEPGAEVDQGQALRRMAADGAVGLVGPDRPVRLLVPRSEALADADDLDSARLALALDHLPDHTVTYQHGVDHVVAAVNSGAAQAGVLLGPATVAQIQANAHAGERMPPKTTFFSPKPLTGLVFRPLDGLN